MWGEEVCRLNACGPPVSMGYPETLGGLEHLFAECHLAHCDNEVWYSGLSVATVVQRLSVATFRGSLVGH